MSNQMIDPTKIKPGDKVALSNRYGKLVENPQFQIGHVFTVTAVKPRTYNRGDESAKVTKTDAVLLLEETGHQEFGYEWFDVVVSTPAVEVTIDFSIDRYRTAREYAAQAIASKMKPKHRDTLEAVGRGEKVNVLALNAALADAFRQNATRYGRSPDRRQGATELQHLQHIVQGTLSNVLQGLPPVDPGTRSPRIKELEVELAKVRAERANLTQERSTLTQAASDERRRLCAEINEYEAAVVAATAELEKITVARDTALQVLGYAFQYVEEDLDKQRVLGFWDAVEPGFRHDFDPQD